MSGAGFDPDLDAEHGERPGSPEALRESIPACDRVAYFNTGATGPSPGRVLDAAAAWERYHKVDVLADADPYEVAFDEYERLRERLAAFLDAPADAIGLTESTADGVSAVAAALDWEPGDVVVRTDLEHPAGTLPFERLERRRGVEVRVVDTEDGRIDTDAFADAVADADLACFSSLSWNYGTRLPVRELCEIAADAGAFSLVDAVQSPGQRPLSVPEWGADAVACSGHKWCLGPWGAGLLYVDPAAAGDLHPAQVSYRSVDDAGADAYDLNPGGARFERGTASPGPHVGLREAVETLESVGLDAVRDRVLDLAGRLTDRVDDHRLLSPEDPESGLVTVDVADPEATVERLHGEGIVIRDLPDPEAVRASVHAFNTEAEVDRLAEALNADP
ncbi:aminotransferase class V-fold PLP-dependent enzyme [Halobaculum magnesiiphilum]|uniref:Aminotransferase class V-fold PLP-dependent enzyme n=1 Tax=Halobaculum magnesiiphilum TaxID=1017351 RepID=A0A8T8WGQ9_9EURY|nr:aminotransferase class V-fold PLP-dependent enzyme [Halobaculum magnesiiphilum]QZP39028.1 aminotransferase class V-fold PLP-dependent enzyme [Halobaculum magnesiiphilum]